MPLNVDLDIALGPLLWLNWSGSENVYVCMLILLADHSKIRSYTIKDVVILTAIFLVYFPPFLFDLTIQTCNLR